MNKIINYIKMIIENSKTSISTEDIKQKKKEDLNNDLNITNLIERIKHIENDFSKKYKISINLFIYLFMFIVIQLLIHFLIISTDKMKILDQKQMIYLFNLIIFFKLERMNGKILLQQLNTRTFLFSKSYCNIKLSDVILKTN
jgi:hypothetical protein